MTRLTFLKGMGVTAVAFWWGKKPVQTTSSGIEIEEPPSDRPAFGRVYRAQVNENVSLKIEMRWFLSGDRYTAGELLQSNGRWVLFEPKRPADKIFDREILPVVQRLCDEILALDAAYVRSDPGEVWEGFVNPFHTAKSCEVCGGEGYSPEGRRLKDMWYGHAPFRPEDRGSVPFTPRDAPVLAHATRNVDRAPDFYGWDTGPAIEREARRLCRLWNVSWSHHLNADDVAALVEVGRLSELTHTFDPVRRWVPRDPPVVPTPREVNVWSLGGFGHDSINQWICVKAECARLGVSYSCAACDWPSAEAKPAYEDWKPTPPPSGEGWQMWEHVSEGSPVSPVFSTARDLAAHMATTRIGGDDGSSAETWLRFIEGPGWAPSAIGTAGGGLVSGVEGMCGEEAKT